MTDSKLFIITVVILCYGQWDT